MRIHQVTVLAALMAVATVGHAPSAPAAAPEERPAIALWPKEAPGEKGDIGEEHDTTDAKGGLVAGKRVIRIGNVSRPTITVYRPPQDKDTGATVVVCPGGGYSILALDLEGTEICDWLNSAGVTGVLLKYRVPARKGQERYQAPLQDAQRALSLVRSRAGEWGLDPKRIGIMGFSAGGHLSAAASNRFAQRAYEPVDATDEVSCRPDFALLIYPAYLSLKDQGDKIAPELTVTSNTPPTFLAQAEDDGVRVENSLFYYLALKNAHVPAEMHLYAQGGHGYGLRPAGKTITNWPRLAEEWMRGSGLLGAHKN